MKYETPELTALTPAIKAIQDTSLKSLPIGIDNWDPSIALHELTSAYADWE